MTHLCIKCANAATAGLACTQAMLAKSDPGARGSCTFACCFHTIIQLVVIAAVDNDDQTSRFCEGGALMDHMSGSKT